MKAWRLVITAVLCVASLSLTGWSVENPGIRNPAGYGTIPQSSYRNGLVSSPSPLDATGNLLMTGNVRRGMHFRGIVPYRSTTSFSATLGSSALNSFLRDTAGSEDFQDRSNKYRVQPFYSPTQTVTTMIPGRSEVFKPMDMRIDDHVRQGASFVGNGLLSLDSLPRGQTSLGQDDAVSDSDFQALQRRYHSLVEPPSTSESTLDSGVSLSSQRADRLVPGQLGIRQERDLSLERSQDGIRDANRKMQDLATDSSRDSESGFVDPQRQQNLPARDGLTQYPGDEVSVGNLTSRLEIPKPIGSPDAERSVTAPSGLGVLDQAAPSTTPTQRNRPLPESQDRREVLEQVRKQLDALTKSVEAGLQEEGGGIGSAESATPHQKVLSASQDAMALSDASHFYHSPPVDSRLSSVDGSQAETRLKSQEGMDEIGILRTVSSLDEFRQRGGRDLSADAERIQGPQGSLESFSQSRFDKHVTDAEGHLKAGRYYRAVDSFTLAAVYQPDNPVVLAGKSHALFAAGEYMSSALFLARMLAVRPDYVEVKVDLAAMLGGADKLTERIADVEQWLSRSGSAQLQFLLSYIYFHMDRLDRAKQSIAAAYEKMPHSPAVDALRTAITRASK